jgi:hypothetical protein
MSQIMYADIIQAGCGPDLTPNLLQTHEMHCVAVAANNEWVAGLAF